MHHVYLHCLSLGGDLLFMSSPSVCSVTGKKATKKSLITLKVKLYRCITNKSDNKLQGEAKWPSHKKNACGLVLKLSVRVAEHAGGTEHKSETETERESERGSREGEKFPVPWPRSRWTGGVLSGP